MAQRENPKDGTKFCCSICLDLLKHPVTIPCGHNYCMKCITSFWNKDEKKTDSCPQCRQTFTPRPALVKNTMLAELVEELKKAGLDPSADPSYAEPEDVACDLCTGRKVKALKSCLVCLASYCEQHLQPHYESPAFQKHTLVAASSKLQETVCSRHNEVMKIFCRTDQQCICYLCSMDEHRGHDTVSAAAERTERQKELEANLQNVQQKIQDKEKDVKMLQQEVKAMNDSANKAVEDTEKILMESVCALKERISKVHQQIRKEQKTKVIQVNEHQNNLNQEIAELKKTEAEVEQLCLTEVHTLFLRSYPSLSQLSESEGSKSPEIRQQQHFDDVTAAVTATRDEIRAILSEKTEKTSTELDNDSVTQTEPRTRAEFLRHSCQITLDPNTACTGLLLSSDNRKVTKTQLQVRPGHPDRFVGLSQVMGANPLTGRCYWEVEKKGRVSVAVTYKNISRAGDFASCAFGFNENSWVLTYDHSFTFRHGVAPSATGCWVSTVGVYLDHGAGSLSFYGVSEPMTLLHRVQTKFTQPLYAGLSLLGSDGDSAEFCELK